MLARIKLGAALRAHMIVFEVAALAGVHPGRADRVHVEVHATTRIGKAEQVWCVCDVCV